MTSGLLSGGEIIAGLSVRVRLAIPFGTILAGTFGKARFLQCCLLALIGHGPWSLLVSTLLKTGSVIFDFRGAFGGEIIEALCSGVN